MRAAEQLRTTGKIERKEATKKADAPRSQRARLNFMPDNDTLAAMIDRGLEALSRGYRWARGSILNLLI